MTTDLDVKSSRILGGLWGAVVGDALGVPVEFIDRFTLQRDPVTDMRRHGTHRQQAGTWSDDSSLLLCSADSLICHEFDTEDMGKRFLAWYRDDLWTAWGEVFDAGGTTTWALSRFEAGVSAEIAGSDREDSNGNGSLMRILPVAMRFAESPTAVLSDRIHRASAITHRHSRSQMACGFYALAVRELLNSLKPEDAFSNALTEFRILYGADSRFAAELRTFDLLLAPGLSAQPNWAISSTGYVVDTLTASLWCLLTTSTFKDCVLKAVNLGGDSDTTGCVAGGLAGIAYGLESIPPEWISQLARQRDLEKLFDQFVAIVKSRCKS